MNRSILFAWLFFFAGIINAQNENSYKFYVGTFTSEGAEGIYLCSFNENKGEVTLEQTFKGIDNPSFLKLSEDKKFLYAVSRVTPEVEKSGGYAVAYKVGENGKLKFINKQVSNGAGPCHIDVAKDGKYVAIATYAGGTTSLYPVAKDGSLHKASSVIVNEGNNLEGGRQSEPHAHSIKFSSCGNKVYSADLGTDQLNIYNLKENKLETGSQPFVKMASGAGPRHFTFHSNENVIYVINELNSTITGVRKEKDNWKTFQNISTLPAGFEGKSYCADIHMSKDGKFLYGSNRGHNSIAVFRVDKNDHTLKMEGTVSVEGNWPRNFGITPDGKFLLVANQRSHNITVFKINKETGMPVFAGAQLKLPAPVCIEFL